MTPRHRSRCDKCNLSREPCQFDLGFRRCVFCSKGRVCVACNKFTDLESLDKIGKHTSPFVCQECCKTLTTKNPSSGETIELLDYLENTGKKVVAHGIIANFARKIDKESYVLVYTNPKLILERNDALVKFSGFYGAHFVGNLDHQYRVKREIKIGSLSIHVSFSKTWGIPWDGMPLVRWTQHDVAWDGDEPYLSFDVIGETVVWATREVGLMKNNMHTYLTRKEIVSAVRKTLA